MGLHSIEQNRERNLNVGVCRGAENALAVSDPDERPYTDDDIDEIDRLFEGIDDYLKKQTVVGAITKSIIAQSDCIGKNPISFSITTNGEQLGMVCACWLARYSISCMNCVHATLAIVELHFTKSVD